MTNLVQIAEELEYVPKEQLIEMSQSPDSRYPQYLVLSEIQRRTQMEKMYNAQSISMNQPQTTVAEEVVTDFAQPQGLAGMNANGSGQAPMPASPMQMAAIGGRTGFQNMGTTSALAGIPNRDRQQLLASLGIDPRGKTEEEIQRELLFMQAQAPEAGGRRLPDAPLVDAAINRQVDLEEVRSPSIEVDEQKKGLGTRVYERLKDRYTDEGEGWGAVDWSNVFWDATMAVPGAGLAGAGLRGSWLAGKAGLEAIKSGAAKEALKKGLQATGRAAAATVSKPGTIVTKGGKEIPLSSPQGRAALNWARNPNVKGLRIKGTNRVVAPVRASATLATLGGGKFAYDALTDEAPIVEGAPNEEEVKKDIQGRIKVLENQEGGKGLGSYLNKFMKQADGLDIAALGGIIMGSRDMSEFGQRITDFANTKKLERAGAKTEARLEALSDIQGAYYQAQIDNMEPEQLQNQMSNIAKMYKLAVEEGDELASNLLEYWEQLNKRLSELQGITHLTARERHQQTVDKQQR